MNPTKLVIRQAVYLLSDNPSQWVPLQCFAEHWYCMYGAPIDPHILHVETVYDFTRLLAGMGALSVEPDLYGNVYVRLSELVSILLGT